MYTPEQEKLAHDFCAAIRTLAVKEENLNNMESYLTDHFSEWMQKWAYDPAGLTDELTYFANMEF